MEKPICDGGSGSSVCGWIAGTPGNCVGLVEHDIRSQYATPPGYKGPLPDCAFTGTCDSVDDLVLLLIRIARWVMGFVGVIAFVFFLAGGVMMIISFGNSERFKQGQDMLVNAVIGLVIVFGAFILVKFILDALGVDPGFRLL